MDYVCLRYPNQRDPVVDSSTRNLSDSVAAVLDTGTGAWVGHCRVISVLKYNQMHVIKLALNHSTMSIPPALLTEQGIAHFCTLEWIRKTMETR